MFCKKYKSEINRLKTENEILKKSNISLVEKNNSYENQMELMKSNYRKMMKKHDEWQEVSLLSEKIKNVPPFVSNIAKIKYIIENFNHNK